jgi:hypothetical protein
MTARRQTGAGLLLLIDGQQLALAQIACGA